jgi:hypothetical protein
MAGATVWSRDIGSEVNKIYKCATLPNLKGWEVSLEIGREILDILEKEDDFRTPALMVEDAQDCCKNTCETIVKYLQELDKKCTKDPKIASVAKAVQEVNGKIDKEIKSLGADLTNVPKKRWETWKKTKKQYKSYKWSCAFKVIGGTVGAIGSAVAIAAAVPTGGATLALGIVGGIRSAASLFETGVKLWAEAETVQAKVMLEIKALQKMYASNKGGAKEAGWSALDAIFSTQMAPTVKTLKADTELWSKKLDGLDVSADAKTKFAIGLLKETEKLDKLLKQSKSKDTAKVLTKLTKAQAALNKAFDACTAESARVRDGRKAIEPIENEVLPEFKKKQPQWVSVFEKVFPVVINLGLAVGDATKGFMEAKNAYDYIKEAGGLLLEVADNVNDLREQFGEK